MKYIIDTTLVLCLLLPGSVLAQDSVKPDLEKHAQVVSGLATEVNDSLDIDISFDLSRLSTGRCRTLYVYPGIEGQKTVYGPALVVCGRMNYVERRRQESLNPKGVEAPDAIGVVSYKKGKTNRYHYQYRVPYDYAWMDSAKVYIHQFVTDCSGEVKHRSRHLLAGQITLGERLPAQRYVVKPVLSFVAPRAEAVKDRQEKGEARLDFMPGKSNILPDYKSNPIELQKIREVISSIKDDKNIIFKGISIKGFASIDGNAATNVRLSLARANSLKEYVRNTYHFSNQQLHVSAEGEDWKGFARLVSESTMSDKDALLGIINTNEPEDRKEVRLKAYKRGSYWQRIAAEIFPLLRKVEYTVNYSVRTFTLEEGQKLILTRPALLSLNEMFLVANSYEKGSEEFNRVFDIAVRLYPDDPTARINAAAISLQKGDMNAAFDYLENLTGAEACNNRGVMYLLEGNLEQANAELHKAVASGSKEAEMNMKEVSMKKADDDLFERLSYKQKR